MKKIYSLFALLCLAVPTFAQCFVTATQTNVSCNGQCNGTANAVATGVPPFQYSWAPGGMTTANVTGLCAGTYTVAVLDGANNVCGTTVTITQPTALTGTSTQVNATCNGLCNGSATAFASGGTTPYTHKWTTTPVQTSGTATGLCAGTYNDTVKDANNCVTVVTVTITQPGVLSSNIVCSSATCFGDSNGTSTAAPTGGTGPYTYTWSTSPVQSTATATGLPAGTYSCTVTDANGCTSSGSCSVTQPTALTVTTSSGNGSATANVSGGITPYTFLWSPGGCTSSTCTGLSSGTYTVTVTDANGCTSAQSVAVTVGIAGYELLYGISLYPNPGDGKFMLEANGLHNAAVMISDELGSAVYSAPLREGWIDVSFLPKGIYFLKLQSEEGYTVKKIVIQ